MVNPRPHNLRCDDSCARHAIDFWLSTEDLPRPENRVRLRRDGSLQISYTPSNDEPKKQLYRQLKSMLGQIGLHPDHLLLQQWGASLLWQRRGWT
jgi:hypothetical protein